MKRITLSDLTMEAYAPYLAVAISTGGIDAAADAAATLGRMRDIRPTDHTAMWHAVNRWMTDTAPATRQRNLAAHDENHRLHHPGAAALLAELGVETSALRILSAIGNGCATAVVDMGDPNDPGTLSQCGMNRKGDLDEIMVPLGAGVYWSGSELLVYHDMIPDTLFHNCIGRAATDLVGHPALDGTTIAEAGQEINSFSTFVLEGMEARPWGKTVVEG